MRILNVFLIAAFGLALIVCRGVSAQEPKAAQKKPAVAPAEKLADGWDEIDQRLIFLMVRLANTETSLEAVEKAITGSSRKQKRRTAEARLSEKKNEDMDRKGGGPVKWHIFYGKTAQTFFYRPMGQSATYHTTQVLDRARSTTTTTQTSQVMPIQRPPQFDYIYRANESAKARAEKDADKLHGQMDALVKRRQRLEAEQAELWCEIAFRAVGHYDLDRRPLYRFEPLGKADAETKSHAEVVKSAAAFMRVALSIIDLAQEDQAATFSKIKEAVTNAREKLGDAWLRHGVDASDKQTTEGKFVALAKRLDDMASNLSDSYVIAVEGERSQDQQRKDLFRGLLQESLVSYAQIVLALDEMAVLLQDQWQITPDLDKALPTFGIPSLERGRKIKTPDDAADLIARQIMPDEVEQAARELLLRAVAWYRAEGNADDSAGTNHGRLEGGASIVPAAVGQSFSFDGTSGSVVVSDAPKLNPKNQFSVIAWINPRAPQREGSQGGIISKVSRAPPKNDGYHFGLSGGNSALLLTFNGPGERWQSNKITVLLNPPIQSGQWTHVAGTYDGTELSLYRNGTLIGSAPVGAKAVASSAGNLRISGDDNGNCHFNGLIDDAAVFDRVLSRKEVNMIYRGTSDGKILDQGDDENPSPPIADDQSADNRDAALVPARRAAQNTVELLDLVELPRDATKGTWVRQGKRVVAVVEKGDGLLRVPYRLPEDYVLDLEVTPERVIDDKTCIALYLGRGNTAFIVQLSGSGSCLLPIDGQDPRQAGNRLERGAQPVSRSIFKSRKRAKVQCKVSEAGLTVSVDGKKIIEWSDYHRLAPRPTTFSGVSFAAEYFTIGAGDSTWAISRLAVRPLEPAAVRAR